jgi:tRNA-specific 2-thiouridylase
VSQGPGKVVVAMSGGVDSSVAAALLLRQGYEVIGVFMRLGELGPTTGPSGSESGIRDSQSGAHRGCCSVLDAADARRVAGVLGIPLYVLNFQEEFGRVIDYFVAEYNRGRTPNPCVRCNDWLKFGRLAQYADAAGAWHIATGHYARVGADPATGRRALFRASDARKDQSYVLFGLRPSLLERIVLPIGGLEKSQVRAMARELNLPVYDKPDSQEICFVPDQDYAALVRQRTPESVREGDLVDPAGNIVGRHPGHQHFTIGQRRGVRLAVGKPVYVTHIDAAANRVTLGDRQSLLSNRLTAGGANWLVDRAASAQRMRCAVKIRYNHPAAPAHLTVTGEATFAVEFDEPQSAIAPGQAVVAYDGEVVLGGGWID